ncbi:uncharacterized protein ASPGLDRAFT_48167 [Aspergillus glaucus CBS 516.65]|uniref:Uncharacterized protein n=1 Tax=Aspergillus glaucus CBS 516.65 TaxID=1160497 RepID=A0A1L9VI48_ASPGL|nr:hypothetical protein ASPGLDRAFT_48167 [Aspergillus glaucus CBS 516.65]OJJ83607.1 hypothetical protein ASPGLDRAFT_48167 [Aspergillus glaucus CBS 516.65]
MLCPQLRAWITPSLCSARWDEARSLLSVRLEVLHLMDVELYLLILAHVCGYLFVRSRRS